VERRKIRLRQAWHIRWPHSSFADFEAGMSSDRQVVHVTSRCGNFFEVGEGALKSVDKTPPVLLLLCKEGLGFLVDGDDMVESATKEMLDVGIVVCRLCILAGRTTATLCGEVDPKIPSKPDCVCRFLCPVDWVLGVIDATSVSISLLGVLYCISGGVGAGEQRFAGHSSSSEDSTSLSVSLSSNVSCLHVSSLDSLLRLRMTL
jgi:hypothetical protein